ncbi:MAG: nucleoside phosphorylase [Ethanoligenens sp.]
MDTQTVEERITPHQFIRHFSKAKGNWEGTVSVSPLVIGSWSGRFIENLVQATNAELVSDWPFETCYTALIDGAAVSFIRLPVGAPAAVSTVECLIACGARRIVGVGMAGSLRPSLRVGDILLAERCLIEEGTSRHYVDGKLESTASAVLADALEEILQAKDVPFQRGKIWTTDAIFRELKSKIQTYRRQGIAGVEMETSALYTIGEFRNVDICNLLVITDELWDEWNPHLVDSEAVDQSLNRIRQVLEKDGIRRLMGNLY